MDYHSRADSLRVVSCPDFQQGTGVPLPRLLIADKNPTLRQTLFDLVHEQCDVVGEVEDGNSVLEAITATKANIVLLGLSFAGTSGFEIARRLLLKKDKVKIIFISFEESQDLVRAAVARGAVGYVFMSRLLDDLPAALHAVRQGRIFTPAS